MADKTW